MKVHLCYQRNRVACTLLCLTSLYVCSPLAAHDGDEHSVDEIPAVDPAVDVFQSLGKFNTRAPISARLSSVAGGSWSTVEDWPVLAVHATILPNGKVLAWDATCLLYTSPSPRDRQKSRMPSSA